MKFACLLALFQTAAQVADKAVTEIMSRLDALAAKLGVAAGALWGIYIKQGYVEGITDTGIGLLFWIAALFMLIFLLRCFKRRREGDYDSYVDSVLVVVLLGLVCLLFVITGGDRLQDGVKELLNPQYWAFQHLCSDMKNIL